MNKDHIYINRLRKISRTGCAFGCGLLILILWGVLLFLNEFKWHILLAIALLLITKITYDSFGNKSKYMKYLLLISFILIYVFFTIRYL
jgi:hypothetical protein